jgi:hypothetical protein
MQHYFSLPEENGKNFLPEELLSNVYRELVRHYFAPYGTAIAQRVSQVQADIGAGVS